MSWLSVGVGVAGAAIGTVGAINTANTNEDLANQAIEDEKDRREEAREQFAQALAAYNELRDERPGLTIEDFIRERIQALNNPQLLEAFDRSNKESLRIAQEMADSATQSNLDNFDAALDAVSGGRFDDLINLRNDLILQDNPQEAFRRAAELQSPFLLPGGSVRLDADGRPISGQRSDAFSFQLAFETQDQLRQRQLGNAAAAIRDDRAAADRQVEKASSFLPFSDFTSFATDLAQDSLASRLAFQTADETRQFQVLRDFAQAAGTNQTNQPVQFSNDSNIDLISSSLDLATRQIASNNRRNNNNNNNPS